MKTAPFNRAESASSPDQWLRERGPRLLVLVLALCLSLPSKFAVSPDMGLDPSWQISLQWAATTHKVFGREFVFTYGPLGYLMIPAAVSKGILLLYGFFVLGSLMAIYRALLPARPRLWDALLLIALAMLNQKCLWANPPTILFTVLCYWLWRIYHRGDWLSLVSALVAAVVLFFGKVNYGLIMVLLIPAFAAALLAFRPKRKLPGLILLLGFPVLIWLGALVWRVDLPGYLRSSVAFVSGYDEAMFTGSNGSKRILLSLAVAICFLLATGVVAWRVRHRLSWREQLMVLPLVGLAVLLLFKNGFVRKDELHYQTFFAALPLLLAVLYLGARRLAPARNLLVSSLLYPLMMLLISKGNFLGRTGLNEMLPLQYCADAFTLPWHESLPEMENILQMHYPGAVLPPAIKSIIGQASVDTMPWESSIAILNGLNYQPRPVPQSYSAYIPWLDGLNATFLSSSNAPAYILYACAKKITIDQRPAAWDESIAKRALLQNYTYVSEFKLPLRDNPLEKLEPASVYLLKHTPQARRLIPVATNEVDLSLGKTFTVPESTNLIFLMLQVQRSSLGKLTASMAYPSLLTVNFNYQDGSSSNFRAVLPILKSGVLLNRRIETADETGNWLKLAVARNLAVASLCFKSTSPWAFRSPFKGWLVEYHLVETHSAFSAP